MMLASHLVGHGDDADCRPMEAVFGQDGASGEAGDDVAVMENHGIGIACRVERQGLLDLGIRRHGLLVVDRG